MDFVVGESFKLTEAIKVEVQESLQKIKKFMKKDVPVSVFLDKVGPREFSVRFSLHYRHRDFVSDEKHSDFHQALLLAKEHMIRQLKDYKSKRQRALRHAKQERVETRLLSDEQESPIGE